jgi:cytosine/adenosine deaminase-related metal-dependent hydrolase
MLMRVLHAAFLTLPLFAQTHDLVIANARVLDPESNLDAVRSIGVTAGKIQAISPTPLQGKRVLDARGLVAAPGFIDLHWHGIDPATDRFEAMDGVTASFELEIGVADVDKAYQAREGRSLIHHGFAVGHAAARMIALGEQDAWMKLLPDNEAAKLVATPEQVTRMRQHVEAQLKKGAVAVGFGLAYTPNADYTEVLEMFRVAARFNAPCHIHIRGGSTQGASSDNRVKGVSEMIAASAITGAPAHIVHVNSSGMEMTVELLRMIEGARARRLDITTEAYPYTAGCTNIKAAFFDEWSDRKPEEYAQLQWVATGERLSKASFQKYRRQGGLVIIHGNTEERVRMAILSPLTMIASDGFDVKAGEGHPRSAGAFSRVLAKYVREEKALPLMDAIRKMTLMPAQRLEQRAPTMRNQGRLKVGADADIAVFDASRITDRSTYEKPDAASEGMRWVLVDGVPVVSEGKVAAGVYPGKGIRAPR